MKRAALAIALIFGLASRAGALVPAGFDDVVLATVAGPTGLAFTPDGRLLITTQPGQLRVYANGALVAAPALDLSSRICTNSERGLLGVAVDPAFATTGFIYLYYTFNRTGSCGTNISSTPVNRVARASGGAFRRERKQRSRWRSADL